MTTEYKICSKCNGTKIIKNESCPKCNGRGQITAVASMYCVTCPLRPKCGDVDGIDDIDRIDKEYLENCQYCFYWGSCSMGNGGCSSAGCVEVQNLGRGCFKIANHCPKYLKKGINRNCPVCNSELMHGNHIFFYHCKQCNKKYHITAFRGLGLKEDHIKNVTMDVILVYGK